MQKITDALDADKEPANNKVLFLTSEACSWLSSEHSEDGGFGGRLTPKPGMAKIRCRQQEL